MTGDQDAFVKMFADNDPMHPSGEVVRFFNGKSLVAAG